MTNDTDRQAPGAPGAERGARNRRHRRSTRAAIIVLDVVVLVAAALVVAGLLLQGRDLPTPEWVAETAGEVLSRGLGGGRAEVGAVTLRIDAGKLPRLSLRDVEVRTPNGSELVAVPELGLSLDRAALWQRRVQPRALRIEGASVRLLRDASGNFDLGFPGAGAPASLGSMGEAIGAVRQAFELPGLAPVERIEIADLALHYEDRRAGRVWRVEGGALEFSQDTNDLWFEVDANLPPDEGAEGPARVSLRLRLGKRNAEVELSAQVEEVAAADVAAHAPALSWLQPLEARVSGAVIAAMTSDGRMGNLDGTLGIGPGLFRPERAAKPIRFDAARAYFSYRPEAARIDFSGISVEGADGEVSASGHAYLEGMETGWPTALTAQLAFDEVRIDRPELLPEPMSFDAGRLEFKATLAPFAMQIGQLRLVADDDPSPARLDARGRVTADAGGWHVALDLGVDRISRGALLARWPFGLAPGTRRWIDNRMIEGTLHNLNAGLRLESGTRPDLGVSFEFRDTRLLPLDSLPPITGAAGFAQVGRDRFALSLDAGEIRPPEGGAIDVSGAEFRIADTSVAPRIGELFWRSRSSVTAALSLLDQPPFRFLSQAGQPVALAEGRAALAGRIAFPLRPGVRAPDVEFEIDGRLSGLTSEVVVPGRRLEAEALSLRAVPSGVSIRGAALLNEVPLEAEFTLPLGPEAGPARVAGEVEIGARFVENLGIGLPDGMVSGAGPADFDLTLPRGAPPAFRLTSNLGGVAMALPALGWSLPARSEGRLEVAGRLGAVPAVDQLAVEAAGLSALGAVALGPGGGLERAIFSRVRLGEWLDAPVTLTGRGPAASPAVALQGGRLDLRRTGFGTGGGAGAGLPLSLALDRLIVSDGLELTGFRGNLTTQGGLSGDFSGQVNGAAPIRGELVPGPRGSTIRLGSERAGGVFKAAGIFGQASGGAMDLVLTPRGPPGEFDGQLRVSDVRVRSASGLAALINAISLVGLIDELNGAGILFDDVEAAFRLTPSFVQVTSSSGVGPSLGITMEGVYDMAAGRLDMQGVFSPVYMVNSIGSIFTRKGEGLFGVTYRMRGPAKSPSVEVNPLSALTPGMFRELFRAPPPRPRGGG